MEFLHILNRGVDKRTVFLDTEDRFRFIHDLFEFNDQENVDPNYGHSLRLHGDARDMDIGRPYFPSRRKRLVHLHCFALMPNHYHLLLSPAADNGVAMFMKKLNMGYSKYFNEKYERSGALWQGKYKSVRVHTDAHFFYIPFYIHFNPLDMPFPEWRERGITQQKSARKYLESYRWSSHLDYMGRRNFPSVTQRNQLLSIFKDRGGYQKVFRDELQNFSVSEVADLTLE